MCVECDWGHTAQCAAQRRVILPYQVHKTCVGFIALLLQKGCCYMKLMELLLLLLPCELSALLRRYAAYISSHLPMFRAILYFPTSGVKLSKKTLEEKTDRLP